MDGMKRVVLALSLVLLSLGIANAQLSRRWLHRAALLNNTLYVYGGEIRHNSGAYIGDLLALDVTKSFSTDDVPWNGDLSSGRPVSSHSLTVGGQDHRFLVSYGGVPWAENVTVFDTKKGSWDTWDGVASTDLTMHTGVAVPNTSLTYIFGGYPAPLFKQESNVLTKFDTLEESIAADRIGPFKRIQHSATMLGDDMYVIGGDTNSNPVSMSDIYIYDTKKDAWSRQTAKGDVPSPRRNHQAVAWGRDIIIYGGDNSSYLPSVDTLAVLNVDSMTWSKPSTEGTPPHPRSDHSMTLVGSNAIIAFGYYPTILNADEATVFILDVETFTWKTQYVPNSVTPKSLPNQPNQDTTDESSKSVDVPTLVVVVIASVALAAIGGILLFRWLRRRARSRSILSNTSTSKMNLASGTLTTDSSLGVAQSPQSPYHPQTPSSSSGPPQTGQPFPHYAGSDIGRASHAPNAYPAHSSSSISEGYASTGQSPHGSMMLPGAHSVIQGSHDSMIQLTHDQGVHGVVMQGAHNSMTDDPGAHNVVMPGAHNSMTDDQGAHDVVMQGANNIMTQEALNMKAQGVNYVHALEQQTPPSATTARSSSPPTSEVVVPVAERETGHQDIHSTDGAFIP